MSNARASRACRIHMHTYMHCDAQACQLAPVLGGSTVPFGRGEGGHIPPQRRHFPSAGTSYLAPGDLVQLIPSIKDSPWYDFYMEPPSRKNRRPNCSFLGCDRPHHSGGLCHSHDAQRRNGKPLKSISFMRDSACSSDLCYRMAKTKGMCAKCYSAAYAERKRLESAHACEGCINGVAYLKSRLCEECKSAPTPTRAELKESFLASRPACELPGCVRPISAVSSRVGTVASRLCSRHATDATAKTLSVDAYVELMSVDSCEACGSTERLVVDHRHGHHEHHAKMCPDCIRGRLCSDCNSALGMLRDSTERISGLLEYIRRF